MGEYFSIVNPAKRQYIDIGLLENPRLHGLMQGLHSRALGLLLWDERRSDEWPFSRIGSWAGDMVYLTGDGHLPTISRNATEYELTYCIDSRTAEKPERNLYWMAIEEFDEISGDALALVDEFEPIDSTLLASWLASCTYPCPAPRRNQGRQLICETIKQIMARRQVSAPGDRIPTHFLRCERFFMVQPATQQFLSAERLGETGDLEQLLGGWHAVVVGRWMLWGDWITLPARSAPIYAAGDRSTTFPPGIEPPVHSAYRNLYQLAQARYTEVTYRWLDDPALLSRLVDQARRWPAILSAIGDAVFKAELPALTAELTRQMGDRWIDQYFASQTHGKFAARPRLTWYPTDPPIGPPPSPIAPRMRPPSPSRFQIFWRGAAVGHVDNPKMDGGGSFQGAWTPIRSPHTAEFLWVLQADQPEVSLDDLGIQWWCNTLPGRNQEDYDANEGALPGVFRVQWITNGVIRIDEQYP